MSKQQPGKRRIDRGLLFSPLIQDFQIRYANEIKGIDPHALNLYFMLLSHREFMWTPGILPFGRQRILTEQPATEAIVNELLEHKLIALDDHWNLTYFRKYLQYFHPKCETQEQRLLYEVRRFPGSNLWPMVADDLRKAMGSQNMFPQRVLDVSMGGNVPKLKRGGGKAIVAPSVSPVRAEPEPEPVESEPEPSPPEPPPPPQPAPPRPNMELSAWDEEHPGERSSLRFEALPPKPAKGPDPWGLYRQMRTRNQVIFWVESAMQRKVNLDFEMLKNFLGLDDQGLQDLQNGRLDE